MEKLNLDKKSIGKIILNYSLEDIEEKLDLLEIKRNVVNPAGWLIAALQVNYLNPELYRKENNEEEKIIETEEVQPEKITPKNKPEEETKRLSREEELEWIKKIRNTVLK